MKTFIGIFFSICLMMACQSDIKPHRMTIYNPEAKALHNEKQSVTKRYGFQNGQEVLDLTIVDSFDVRGNRVQQVLFNPDSSNYHKIIYAFDSNDNHKSRISFNKEGLIVSRFKSKYDADNNEIESVLWDSTGNVVHKRINQYENGKIKKSILIKDSIERESFHEHDSWGRRISRLNYENGELVSKEFIEYENY
jgi:antitoxin component YwqK of YwqJK toxin-antitoxin module